MVSLELSYSNWSVFICYLSFSLEALNIVLLFCMVNVLNIMCHGEFLLILSIWYSRCFFDWHLLF